MKSREDFGVDSVPNTLFDFTDWQVRIGFHPGVRVYVPRHRRHRQPRPRRRRAAGQSAADRNGDVQPLHRRTGGRSTLTAKAQESRRRQVDVSVVLSERQARELWQTAETGWMAPSKKVR
jgi:hypothetical protein